MEARYNGTLTEHGQTEDTYLTRYYNASYTFDYNGRQYTAHRNAFFPDHVSPQDEPVTIRINPENPEEIEDTAKQFLLIGGMALFAFMTWFGCYVLKHPEEVVWKN